MFLSYTPTQLCIYTHIHTVVQCCLTWMPLLTVPELFWSWSSDERRWRGRQRRTELPYGRHNSKPSGGVWQLTWTTNTGPCRYLGTITPQQYTLYQSWGPGLTPPLYAHSWHPSLSLRSEGTSVPQFRFSYWRCQFSMATIPQFSFTMCFLQYTSP